MKDFDHHAVADFCGWSALVPISIYREFLAIGNTGADPRSDTE